ncbi:coilin-like [Iris pallida]|uniref:Coilin-like n=1 Tax=Iris pallida TaxID=29817 RepID=A0AAX6HPA0_IRIPA|nr:coilin-like [Iris pallida]
MGKAPARIRVVFDDQKLLSRSQRLEGLKHSWLLLTPELATIADVADQLRERFGLKRSCGLLLSMDDFVLPSFESTCILKDRDIIRVREKGASQIELIETGDDQDQIQDIEFVDQQPVCSSREFLAITKFQEDRGGRQSKDEEDSSPRNDNPIPSRICTSENTNSKRKRKHSDDTSDSKGKKLKLSSSKVPKFSDEANKNIHSGRKGGSSLKEKHSNGDVRLNRLTTQLEDTVEEMHSHEQKKGKRKKSKLIRPEKAIVATENADAISREQNYSCFEKGEGSQESLQKKHGASSADGCLVVPIDSVLDGGNNKLSSSVPTEERTDKHEENTTCEPHVNGSSTKDPSRNARRKKARRKWLLELKSQDKDIQSEQPPNDIHKKSIEHEERDLDSEMQEEVVPVVIRPGHIRFEPLDADQSLCQPQGSMETLQWNGITSKKKGQKWGRENTSRKWNEVNGHKEQYNRASATENWTNDDNNEKSITEGWKTDEKSISGGKNSNGKSIAQDCESNGKPTAENWKSNGNSTAEGLKTNGIYVAEEVKNKEKSIVEERPTGDGGIDFESLSPLTRLPQDGDLLVYQLVELSSSWCPELSPFRVGKVSSFDPISMTIILVPVPEYPIFSDENIEEEELMDQSDFSAYKEDGSLEVHYPSLVNVRLLEANRSEASTAEYGGREVSSIRATPVNNLEQESADKSAETIDTSTVAPPMVNEPDSSWEQIKQAISDKKAQLQKNSAPDDSTRSKTFPRSHRGLRGSAMGPTLAFLRGQNVLDPVTQG